MQLVQYSTIQCSTVQCSTVQYSTGLDVVFAQVLIGQGADLTIADKVT